jgi:hypothetical protein
MKMKKTHLLSLLLCMTLMVMLPGSLEAQQSLKRKLKKIPGVVSVEQIPNTTTSQAKYLIFFEQPVNHQNPKAGKFRQRIFLIHNGFKTPMVITTEGYSAEYAARPNYTDEIADKLNASQMVIEHRYFGESVPKGAGWDPLTAEQAAADHHRIIEAFKTLYTGKRISTGISKGGTTCLIHRVLYPNDVDITVSYVAPLNLDVEDGRHESFISTNAQPEYRNAVRLFQWQVLLRRDTLMSLLEQYVAVNSLTFNIPLEEIYDYLVLEYAFSFYQWGWDYAMVPGEDATHQEVFMHFVRVSNPEYFARESFEAYLPFFVQASRQLGYYGYSISPFYDWLKIPTAEGYLPRIMLPDTIRYTFDRSLTDRVQHFLDHEDPRMIFIYGEWDPWTASGVVFDWREKKQMIKVVKPAGSHLTRIGNLPEKEKQMVWDTIDLWLKAEAK